MTRANARELAVHLIYSREFTNEEPEDIISSRLDKAYYFQLSDDNTIYADHPDPQQLAYIDRVVVGVANRSSELNAIIQKYAIGWDVSRISRLARAILQLAIFEIQFLDDVPTGVAISEAVRITKLYDGEDASSFINGILGSFAKEISPEVKQ